MSDMVSFIILLVVFGIAMLLSKFGASVITNAMAPIDKFDSMTYEEKENTIFGLILLDGALAGFFYYFIAYFITSFAGNMFATRSGMSVLDMAKYAILVLIFIKGLRPARSRGLLGLLGGARFGMHITSSSVIGGYVLGGLLADFLFK